MYIPYKKSICGMPSEEAEAYIREHTEIPRKQIATDLGIPYNILLLFISTHGLARDVHNRWSDEEIDFLFENFSTMTKAEIAERLGRTKASISGKAQELLLDSGRNRQWTRREIAAAVDMYKAGYTSREIAEKLGRNEKSVASKLWRTTDFRKKKRSKKNEKE